MESKSVMKRLTTQRSCQACYHMRPDPDEKDMLVCHHPVIKPQSFYGVYIYRTREAGWPCGPTGKLFEEKL